MSTTITEPWISLILIEKLPWYWASQSCQWQFSSGRSWTGHCKGFSNSNPFSKVSNRFKPDVIKLFLLCIVHHLLNNLLQNRRAPHSWSICISDVCKSFISWAFKWCLTNFLLQVFYKISIIFFCTNRCLT